MLMMPELFKTISGSIPGYLEYFSRIAGKRCPVCGTAIKKILPGTIVCLQCSEELKARKGGFCGMCARIYAMEDESTHLCFDCRKSPFSWQGISFYSVYHGLLKDIILRYKFNGDLGLGSVLGNLLYQAARIYPLDSMDCIVPVPLHTKKLRHRGFNQSLELSRILSRKIRVPVFMDALVKTRHTPPQSLMDRKVRLKSLKKVFAAQERQLKSRNILLVDDIMTTGATLEECTRTMLRAGASEVRVVFLARAV